MMANYVLIEDGVVVQSDRTWQGDAAHPSGFISAPDEVVPGFLFDGKNFSEPVVPSVPVITILYPVDLWSRLTNAEAEKVEVAMGTQRVRVQNIFRAASSYRSDHELWPLLQSIAVDLFGKNRAAEILAAS